MWTDGGWAGFCSKVRIYGIQGQQVAFASTHGTGTHTFLCMHVACVWVRVHVCKPMWRSENTLKCSFAHSGQGLADMEFTK